MVAALLTTAVLIAAMILRWIVFPPELSNRYETRMRRLREMRDSGEISEDHFEKAKEYYDKHPSGTFNWW
jgi:hypothetical protein